MSRSLHNLDEKNSYKYTFTVTDSETGNKLPLSSIATLLCTQFYYNSADLTADSFHLATINGRYNQNVLNANDVTITTSGTIVWLIQPEDTTKLNTALDDELHVALFTWMYSTGKQNSHMFFNYISRVPYIADIP